jgi:DNA repair protein RecN (Recombination protein N)
MLAALSIRDIVLIDKLDLAFEGGLTVLTGETGAGKSILLDALALALGARGDAALVRSGCAQGQVTASFDVPGGHPVWELLRRGGVEGEGEALILRRVQTSDGRTRAFVNDQPVPAQLLRVAGAALVEIHGQHDDRALADADAHRRLLDAHAGLTPQAAEVREAWADASAARAARDAAADEIAAIRREADYLRHAHDELAKLAPAPAEEELLAGRRQAMMAAEKIAGDLDEAYEALDGPASPLPTLASTLRRLERKQAQMPAHLAPVVAALGAALDEIEKARAGLGEARRAADFDPKELERTEERLFALRAAARKFGVPVVELPALAARFAAELDALDAGEERLAALERRVAEAEDTYRAAAATLSRLRRKAAGALDKAVGAELAPLKLERARFLVRVESGADRAGPAGIDQVEFHVQTNPGTAAGPLMKVASGGELARFMLALKVVLADAGSAPTLVFDEVDTGVGGAVADAIGQRLARLARSVQVLAVTHAPQVAARAGGHVLIEKQSVERARVATRVRPLREAARREEIARMLSGADVTDEARAQADRLLSGGA